MEKAQSTSAQSLTRELIREERELLKELQKCTLNVFSALTDKLQAEAISKLYSSQAADYVETIKRHEDKITNMQETITLMHGQIKDLKALVQGLQNRQPLPSQ